MNLVKIYLVEMNLNLVEMNLVEIDLVEMDLNPGMGASPFHHHSCRGMDRLRRRSGVMANIGPMQEAHIACLGVQQARYNDPQFACHHGKL